MSWILSAFADEASQEIDGQLAALAEAGLQYVDLRSVDSINITELPLDHARRVQKQLTAASVSVCMFGSPIGKTDITDDLEIELTRLRHLSELADLFDTRRVRIFSFYNRDNRPLEAWQNATIERLRRLTEEAQRLNLTLYLENELDIFGSNCKRVSLLRDTLCREAPEHFKLIFDFDNFNQNSDDVWEAWEQLREDVSAIHLKESKRQPDGTFQHVPVGQGDGRVAEVLLDCRERGWKGPLILEPHLAHSPAVMATGPHGQANRTLSDLTPHACFVLAARTAQELIREVQA